VGSVVGGLIYGGRDWPGTVARQLCVLLLLVGGGFAFVAAAPTLAWLYPLMFVAGLACAPAATALTTSFSRASGGRTESFAWLASSSNLGGSFGYAAAGLLLAHTGITITILVGAAFPAAAAAAVAVATARWSLCSSMGSKKGSIHDAH
jgi:predicted MFS family arabinose efflux permease